MICSKLLKQIGSIAVIAVLASSSAWCQTPSDTTRPSVGISAVVQGDQKDLVFPIWLGRSFVLAPEFYLVSVSGIYSDYGAGIAFRAYLRPGKARPYLGARGGMLIGALHSLNSNTDVLFGPFVGGEYFLDRHLSLGVECQLNVTRSSDKSLRFGNPGGTNVNTATAVMATFYF